MEARKSCQGRSQFKRWASAASRDYVKNPKSRSFIKVIRAVQRVVVISPIDHDEEYDEYLKESISMKQ